MADPITSSAPDDDLLTAFLDGELGAEARRAMEARLASEPQLKARFDALASSARPFAQSFALVFEAAPAERMREMLNQIEPHAGPVAPRRVWMSAAAVLLFAVGIAVGVGTGNGPSPFASHVPAMFDVATSEQSAKTVATTPGTQDASRARTEPSAQAGSASVNAAAPPPPVASTLATTPVQPVAPAARQALPQQFAAAPPPAAPKASGEVPPQAFGLGGVAPAPAPSVPSASSNALASGLAVAPGSAPAADALGTLQPPPSWRQVVVEYLVLTTPETLALIPENPRLSDAVAAYAGKMQLDLSTDKLMLPMAALKDVRLFDYRGRPLVEAAYLSDDAVAVAFCIILNGQTDVPMAFEQREGQNIVFWAKGGHGYMVAGKAPRERLEAIARDFAARFG